VRSRGTISITAKTIVGLVSILQRLAAAEIANALHLRDFRSPAIFEFFNSIGATGHTYAVSSGLAHVPCDATASLNLVKSNSTDIG
jgi:glycyl-tRNA synthetase beta subunit